MYNEILDKLNQIKKGSLLRRESSLMAESNELGASIARHLNCKI